MIREPTQPENQGVLSSGRDPQLTDGSRDPGLPFYQGPKPVFDTNSQKTGTIVLRKPLYAVRSAGIGIQRAPKKPLLAPFGATISGWIVL